MCRLQNEATREHSDDSRPTIGQKGWHFSFAVNPIEWCEAQEQRCDATMKPQRRQASVKP